MTLKKNILLVEDDLDDQVFFTEALGEIENATLYGIVNNGAEALEKLQNSIMHPDIIFMDINMPVMNGIECLERIINTPHIKNIPVVIISTSANEMEAVRKSGAKAFVKKPSDIKTLRDKIEYIVNLDFKTDTVKAEKTFENSTIEF